MKTDSLFYRIFQTLPEIFFTLTGFDYCSQDYAFQAIEIKQTAFRLDGVFKPVRSDSNLHTIFVATNLRRDSFMVKPFVVSLSNHERLNHSPFDKLRANG